MKYECENCKLNFDSEDPQNCPRCSSRKIRRSFADKKKFGEKGGFGAGSSHGSSNSSHGSATHSASSLTGPFPTGSSTGSNPSSLSGPTKPMGASPTAGKVFFSHQSNIGRDGKEGWRDFHKSEVRVCQDCGGTEFDFNWKRKERSCKKCGSIYPLARRMG
ncbi:MAG: hypothetical protein AABX01_02625 [Candidatus Micrarchaeota archaeon]